MNTIFGDFKEENGDVPFELNRSEIERLAILSEECAEVQQIIGKILRHGFTSYNPFDKERTSNRELLEEELGDLLFAIQLLVNNEDISQHALDRHKNSAFDKKGKYLHFNKLPQ